MNPLPLAGVQGLAPYKRMIQLGVYHTYYPNGIEAQTNFSFAPDQDNVADIAATPRLNCRADREMSHTAIQWSISWTAGRRQRPRSQLLEPLCGASAVDLDGTKLYVLITSNEVRQPRDLGGELDGLW